MTAQNLCTNGDFDTYTTPPSSYAQICRATGWTTPSGLCNLIAGTGSPDYYNSAGSGGAQPPSTWWATVSPHSGGGMAGFATWYTSNNYREYVSRQLSSPMVPGVTYQVTIWITNGISWLHLVGTDNIGINFSLAPLTQTLGNPILLTPQLETTSVIYDTAWRRLSFTYVANAAYQYVTFGNFHDDANTQKQSFGSGTYANYGTYYYIDDIDIHAVAPLPVEWLRFAARGYADAARLTWATASESGSDYFEVERSDSGDLFHPVGRVGASGYSTTVHEYEFTDKTFVRSAWYRLRQVDLNGHFEYSPVEYAGYDPGDAVELEITVEGDFLRIKGFAPGESDLAVTLCAISGRVVSEFSFRINDMFDRRLPIRDLAEGCYVATAILRDHIAHRKIIR